MATLTRNIIECFFPDGKDVKCPPYLDRIRYVMPDPDKPDMLVLSLDKLQNQKKSKRWWKILFYKPIYEEAGAKDSKDPDDGRLRGIMGNSSRYGQTYEKYNKLFTGRLADATMQQQLEHLEQLIENGVRAKHTSLKLCETTFSAARLTPLANVEAKLYEFVEELKQFIMEMCMPYLASEFEHLRPLLLQGLQKTKYDAHNDTYIQETRRRALASITGLMLLGLNINKHEGFTAKVEEFLKKFIPSEHRSTPDAPVTAAPPPAVPPPKPAAPALPVMLRLPGKPADPAIRYNELAAQLKSTFDRLLTMQPEDAEYVCFIATQKIREYLFFVADLWPDPDRRRHLWPQDSDDSAAGGSTFNLFDRFLERRRQEIELLIADYKNISVQASSPEAANQVLSHLPFTLIVQYISALIMVAEKMLKRDLHDIDRATWQKALSEAEDKDLPNAKKYASMHEKELHDSLQAGLDPNKSF